MFKDLEKFIKDYQQKNFKERLAERGIQEDTIKQFDFCKVKANSIDVANRTVEVIATKEVVDRQGDIIKVAGIDVNAFIKNPVVPFAHDYSELPVARAIGFKFEEDQMTMKLQFTTKALNPFGDKVFNMFKEGFLNAVSIGFIPIKEAFDTELNANVIEKSELLEVSVVPIPANQAALAKAFDGGYNVPDKNKATIEVEMKVKSPACRLENETIDECRQRKIPELMSEEGMPQDQAVAVATSLCKEKCSDKAKELSEANMLVLKKYRKFQVLLRDALGITATEDEAETIDQVMTAALGTLNLVTKAIKHLDKLESEKTTSGSKNTRKQEATRPVKPKKNIMSTALRAAQKL